YRTVLLVEPFCTVQASVRPTVLWFHSPRRPLSQQFCLPVEDAAGRNSPERAASGSDHASVVNVRPEEATESPDSPWHSALSREFGRRPCGNQVSPTSQSAAPGDSRSFQLFQRIPFGFAQRRESLQ